MSAIKMSQVSSPEAFSSKFRTDEIILKRPDLVYIYEDKQGKRLRCDSPKTTELPAMSWLFSTLLRHTFFRSACLSTNQFEILLHRLTYLE